MMIKIKSVALRVYIPDVDWEESWQTLGVMKKFNILFGVTVTWLQIFTKTALCILKICEDYLFLFYLFFLDQGLTMLPRLVLNSCSEVILLPQTPE